VNNRCREGLFLIFPISALPWTNFWRGEVLPRAQALLNQESPAGFSNRWSFGYGWPLHSIFHLCFDRVKEVIQNADTFFVASYNRSPASPKPDPQILISA
jgi:hypothetical protein